MIFTVEQDNKINSIIEVFKNQENVEWVLREEERKYMNTIDECLTICLGHGELDHLTNKDYDNWEETYYYYSKKQQLDYIIHIFRYTKDQIRVVVYKANNGKMGGSHKVTELTI